MSNPYEIIAVLDRAANAIAGRDPADHWHSWLLYILEVLQTKVHPVEFRAFLIRLRSEITNRLEIREW